MNLILNLILIEIILIKIWSPILCLSIEDWNPFRSGTIYRAPFRFLSSKGDELMVNEVEDRAGRKGTTEESAPTTSTTVASRPTTTRPTTSTVSSTTAAKKVTKATNVTVDWDSILVNIPPSLRYKCLKDKANLVSIGGQMKSGMYCLFMDTVFTCMNKAERPNHYPIVGYIKEYDKRYQNVKINSAAMIGVETHIFSYHLVISFVEQERIRILPKRLNFGAITSIIPTASFAFDDHEDPEKWILVVDNATDPDNGPAKYYRHFIERGQHLVEVIALKEEIDAAAIFLRHNTYVMGYSVVGEMFYKFIFSTKDQYSSKSELSRMLWGHTSELIGCPKPICKAPVVDTLVKLKDNCTYLFVGKYYWNMTDGITMDKAVFVDAVSTTETHFHYLVADLDASFYDTVNDTVYFIRGEYVYSFTDTAAEFLGRDLHAVSIHEVFKGIPRNINAAFYYRPNATVYFFTGYHYWAYNLGAKKKGETNALLPGYPRLVTDFEGMPANIDAIYSDNLGTYRVFFGVFFATFTEDEFKIGMKLEFQLSSVDFFGCDPSIYGNYDEYKKKMETEFGAITAQQLLDRTDSEGIDWTDEDEEHASEHKSSETSTPEESFLTTFAKLLVYGPFLQDLFVEVPGNKTLRKSVFSRYVED